MTTIEPVRLEREKLLQALDEVSAGLSITGIMEQSKCFIFQNGKVYTFNEEVACAARSGLPKELTGAVQAQKMIEFLRKFKGVHLTVKANGSKLVLVGNKEKAGLSMDRKILLPIDAIEHPTEWTRLHEDFTDAVGIVGECASKDQELFTCTCIHIHPKWMEAFDNAQMTRYRFPTGADQPFLVRRDSLKYLPAFDFTHMALTESWVHFKSKSKTVMSCKRYIAEAEDFQDLSEILKTRGKPTVLPKSLSDAADKAELAVREEGEDGNVLVDVSRGSIQITGRGQKCWYKKEAQVRYKGPPMRFRVAPKLLQELVKRNADCEISSKGFLVVDGGKFKWVVCLEEA